MTQVFAPGLQVKQRTVVSCLRELPVAGDILVKEGDSVFARDVVASAFLSGDLYVFRIAEKLGIENFEVSKGLKVKEGDLIKKGDLICEHMGLFGLFNSRFYAPEEGIVEFFSKRTGHLGVRSPARKLEVLAHISGEVKKVVERRSVLIEAECAFIQGIFGVGGEQRGILRNLDLKLGDCVLPEHIPQDCCDCILIGGTKPTLQAIQKAVEVGARGLVVGSIDDETLKAYLGYDLGIALTGDEQIPLTLIVTEGFGYIPFSNRVYEVCSKFEDSFVSINGATQVRAGAMRPEIIIAQCSDKKTLELEKFNDNKGLRVGKNIRIIRVPYFGLHATITELPTQMERVPSGAETRVLRAKLENGKIVTVPRANVELL